MKPTLLKLTFLLTISLFAVLTSPAQFTLKNLKIGQPKPSPSPVVPQIASVSQPGPRAVQANSASSAQSAPAAASVRTSKATENPVVLKTTLDIRCDTEARYWKLRESNYTSWCRRLGSCPVCGNRKLRLMVEYFNPRLAVDSEMVKRTKPTAAEQTTELITDRVGYRFTRVQRTQRIVRRQITDTRDGSVLFKGKFRVGKFKYGPEFRCSRSQTFSLIRIGTCRSPTCG